MSAYVLAHSDRFTVYHGDALEVLPRLRTESFDLIVADPPYGVEWQSNMRATTFDQLANDGPGDRDGIRAVIGEAVRLVGQHRHLYVFGPADVLEGHKVSEVTELIWQKPVGMGDLAKPWAPAHERISFAVSQHRHGGKAGCPALPVRLRKGSVLTFGRPTGRNVRHPSEKPVGLLRELIESSTRADETVLDPFAGVGSSGVAALLSGRRAVLVELDEHFAQLAAARCQKAERLWTEGGTL